MTISVRKPFGAPAAMLAVALLVAGSLACGRGELEKGLSGPVPASPEELMAELQTQKQRIDRATDEMMKRIDVFNASRAPGDRKIQFSELFYADLNPEQRDVLEQLLKEEESPTYKSLLQKIMNDRGTIQELQDRVLRLEQRLDDKFVIAKKDDTHYDLAVQFLQEQGVEADKIKQILKPLDLSEDILPGFQIWFNYNEEDGAFKTYVTQGESGQTPLAVKRAVKRNLIGERDVAVATAAALEQTKQTLEEDIARLETDINGLEDRRSTLDVQVADLEARNDSLRVRGDKLAEDLEFRENSLFYHAASEKALAQQGILTRFLKNLKDVKGVSYDESLDLRQARTIDLDGSAFGLKRIRGVEIWPEIYQEGRDYSVKVSEDGATATVVINDPHIFRQQRVLIALRGESS